MPFKRKLTREQELSVCRLVERGVRTDEISRIYSVSQSTISRVSNAGGAMSPDEERRALRRSLAWALSVIGRAKPTEMEQGTWYHREDVDFEYEARKLLKRRP